MFKVREREQEREGWKSHIHELDETIRGREAEAREREEKEDKENKAGLKSDLAESKSQISSLRNEGQSVSLFNT